MISLPVAGLVHNRGDLKIVFLNFSYSHLWVVWGSISG